jgi:hypothetical protein
MNVVLCMQGVLVHWRLCLLAASDAHGEAARINIRQNRDGIIAHRHLITIRLLLK